MEPEPWFTSSFFSASPQLTAPRPPPCIGSACQIPTWRNAPWQDRPRLLRNLIPSGEGSTSS